MTPLSYKPDSKQIENLFTDLINQPWVKNSARRWWPKFVYHYTDITNAVKILNAGNLYSREMLEQNNGIPHDAASSEIIAKTELYKKKFVRLYFRPRTPTQYHMEGVRPISQRGNLGAHCPVPVFFLFDSIQVLTRSDCAYSNGNLASPSSQIGNSVDFLNDLPFKKIYHDGFFNSLEKPEITFHRNAEVLIQDQLDLAALKYIFCRSAAEKDTLLQLLPNTIKGAWQDKVYNESRANLYMRRWTFVENIDLTLNEIIFTFSPDSITPGPFNAEVFIENLDSGEIVHLVNPTLYARKKLRVNVPKGISSYKVSLKLDGDLVCINSYMPAEVLF